MPAWMYITWLFVSQPPLQWICDHYSDHRHRNCSGQVFSLDPHVVIFVLSTISLLLFSPFLSFAHIFSSCYFYTFIGKPKPAIYCLSATINFFKNKSASYIDWSFSVISLQFNPRDLLTRICPALEMGHNKLLACSRLRVSSLGLSVSKQGQPSPTAPHAPPA